MNSMIHVYSIESTAKPSLQAIADIILLPQVTFHSSYEYQQNHKNRHERSNTGPKPSMRVMHIYPESDFPPTVLSIMYYGC